MGDAGEGPERTVCLSVCPCGGGKKTNTGIINEMEEATVVKAAAIVVSNVGAPPSVDRAMEEQSLARRQHSRGYGGERKSPGTRNQCMGSSEICIGDIFRGRKSRGLTYRRAVNTFSHQKREK